MPRFPHHTLSPPLIEIAVGLQGASGRKALDAALDELSRRDSTLCLVIDPDSGLVLLGGQSEAQLDASVGWLREKCAGNLVIGTPQIAYRETIDHACEVDFTHKKPVSGIGQFARVQLRLEPGSSASGTVLRTAPPGSDMPELYLAGAEKGVRTVLGAGISAGFPVTNIVVTILDGAWHDHDSSEVGFEIAARAAMREGLQKAGSYLLEPIMDVRIAVPEPALAAALRDLRARRAVIERKIGERGLVTIVAQVPLSNLFGYRNALDMMMHGREAHFEMSFRTYSPVPKSDPPDDPRFPPAMAMQA